ncbi:hypothetical protein EJB05_57020, partial [Eragrostis curvula]
MNQASFDVSFLAPKVKKQSWVFTNLDVKVDGFPFALKVHLGCSLKCGVRTLRVVVGVDWT